jgi:hypothetical protein
METDSRRDQSMELDCRRTLYLSIIIPEREEKKEGSKQASGCVEGGGENSGRRRDGGGRKEQIWVRWWEQTRPALLAR